MLINDTSHQGSGIIELLVSAAIVAAVGFGVYAVQHPAETKRPAVTQAG